MNCAHETTLRFLPPYIIRKTEVRAMVTNLEGVIIEEATLARQAQAKAPSPGGEPN
jgi:acetylornithine/succinyldiaminopimelate/putrescine aminotransferase